jgi:hypothetical protein
MLRERGVLLEYHMQAVLSEWVRAVICDAVCTSLLNELSYYVI